ncbi:MAG: hypothetical protein IJ740_07460 [Ruminococcus sp.]|nr:hypothetical protein [Ruminococcus sp.]
MEKPPSRKAKIFCVILVLAATALFITAGIWQMNIYEQYKSCTSKVTGIVVNESFGRIYDPDEAQTKFVTSEKWIQIEVETDSGFSLGNIYADHGSEKINDRITIYYDPNDPEKYCIGNAPDYHKTTAVIIFVLSGILPLFLIFIMIKSYMYYKLQAENQKKYIYFDTPYCRFVFVDSDDTGFEGGVEWKYNLTGEKTCTVFFETDISVTPPREGYYGLIEKKYLGREEETTFDINKLAQEIRELKSIQPGKCYDRLENILLDKERRDSEIRKIVADHFLFRTELIKENSTEQELMDSIEISCINVHRNGDTEFIIFESDIYIEDLRVILKGDGSKEIHYKTNARTGAYDECCDVL